MSFTSRFRGALGNGDRWPADDDQDARRRSYLEENTELSRIWELRIGSPSGPLPGSTLDAMLLPSGWCGQVQLEPGEHSTSDVAEASTFICDVYGVPHGALHVEAGHAGTADTAFLRAYGRPSAVDYHVVRDPLWVSMEGRPGEEITPGQLTEDARSELGTWAREYLLARQPMLEGSYIDIDIELLTRRYNRMRGAIIDALARADTAEVINVLTEAGMTFGAMPRELAREMGWNPTAQL